MYQGCMGQSIHNYTPNTRTYLLLDIDIKCSIILWYHIPFEINSEQLAFLQLIITLQKIKVGGTTPHLIISPILLFFIGVFSEQLQGKYKFVI